MVLICLKKFRGTTLRSTQTKTHQNGDSSNQQYPGYIGATPRPPLTRIDSRNSLTGVRPGFPNQPGVAIRPQQVRQPIPGQQFIQRQPGTAPRPPGQPQFIQNQGNRPVNPNFRPSTPFPRPQTLQGQGPRQPGIFQQRSVPAFNQQRPPLESDQPLRSQTLDSTDSINKTPENAKIGQDDSVRTSVNSMKNRSFSLSSNLSDSQGAIEDERRRSVSSIGSYEERKSTTGSIENLDKKSDGDYPSRPESRASSRMNKIMEDDDADDKFNTVNKSPSPQTPQTPQMENSPKTVEFKIPTEEGKNIDTNKSPINKMQEKSEVVDNVLTKPKEESKSIHKTKSPSPVNRMQEKSEVMDNVLTRTKEESKSINKAKSPSPVNKMQEKSEVKDKVLPKPKEEKLIKNVPNGLHEKPRKPETKNLELKTLKKAKSPSRSEGDNDSGVDESTQGNDQSSNGDHSSPRKSSGKTPSRTSSTTPTKNRSLSRGSKSPSLKSPDSTASTPGTTEKKKVPMNKVQVGSAPSPNLKVVRSKIGSLENASYKPGGGKVKIESKKLDFKNASSRIEAKNEKYTPKGGDKKIQQQKLQWNAKPKVGSLENATHKPKGGDKKIESVKLDFKEKAKPKVGSKDNIKHSPGGGEVKIENKKLDIKVQSKVGSMDNVKHRPGGGDKKIFDDKEYLKQKSAISSENQSLSGSQNSLPSQPEAGGPVADENLNQER